MSEIEYNLKPSKICSQFLNYNYKQPAGTIFTDWNSAGITGSVNKETISEYPLKSANNLVDSKIVKNNNNNLRNNFQNHGTNFQNSSELLNQLAIVDNLDTCNYSNANF